MRSIPELLHKKSYLQFSKFMDCNPSYRSHDITRTWQRLLGDIDKSSEKSWTVQNDWQSFFHYFLLLSFHVICTVIIIYIHYYIILNVPIQYP